jgi:hypothetical protein
MGEGENVAVNLFNKAAEFWTSNSHAELSPLGEEHMKKVLAYAKEHPEEVEERAKQLDMAIARFNEKRLSGTFGTDEENSSRLANEILEPGETLPLLSEMPSGPNETSPFFAAFTNLIHHGYYTFVNKPELEDPKLLITGLLVDGYGVALRAKRAIEHKHTVGKDDLVIVNAICEMVQPGTLQTEMYLANWYKPDFGLTPEFCERIAKQFGELKPLIKAKLVQQ